MMLVCGICGLEFEDEASMREHEHEAPAAAALTCPVCGDGFEAEEDLVAHQSSDHVGVDLPDEEQAVP